MRTTIKLFLPIIIALSITFTSTAQPSGSFISEEAQESCVKYGEEYGICPELLMAMIEKESSGRPDVESGGCKGLMQISDCWHKDRIPFVKRSLHWKSVSHSMNRRDRI